MVNAGTTLRKILLGAVGIGLRKFCLKTLPLSMYNYIQSVVKQNGIIGMHVIVFNSMDNAFKN